jgi:hypothetical protein
MNRLPQNLPQHYQALQDVPRLHSKGKGEVECPRGGWLFELSFRQNSRGGRLNMNKLTITIAFGLAGWALCGATMGIAMAATRLSRALVIHAIAAPVIFSVVSIVHSRASRPDSPVKAAVIFSAVVILMDVFVVALMIERSFQMFASPLGTWIPFSLIFVSSWITGALVTPPARP